MNKALEEQFKENPVQAVAIATVQVIAELSQMLYAANGHDEKSEATVLAACAWLTSLIDGKEPVPEQIIKSAANTLDLALRDEVVRAQHYLAQMVERTTAAESKALVNELYASWYLRLRDDNSGDLEVGERKLIGGGEFDFCSKSGEELDQYLEDLDEYEEDVAHDR